MKKEGDKLFKLALGERKRLGSAYDSKWKLGHLLQKSNGSEQFNAYGFCVHCITVGIRMAHGICMSCFF